MKKFTIVVVCLFLVSLVAAGCGQSQKSDEATQLVEEYAVQIDAMRGEIGKMEHIEETIEECIIDSNLPCVEDLTVAAKARGKIVEGTDGEFQALNEQAEKIGPKIMRAAAAEYKKRTARNIIAEAEEIASLARAQITIASRGI